VLQSRGSLCLSLGARLGRTRFKPSSRGGWVRSTGRDTRLDRTVAIKVLPAELSADPERRARFEREAKTIAGLTHPHICSLHDVGEHDGSRSSSWSTSLGNARRPPAEGHCRLAALTVATEIADALSTAHRQGIVHPRPQARQRHAHQGRAKLLDFGLAKLKGHGERPAAAPAVGGTQSAPRPPKHDCRTLPYMAPEQVEGKPADARTDLWALGALLYEMVTARGVEARAP